MVHSIATYRRFDLDRRAVLERYRFVDLALEVVGVGSVGDGGVGFLVYDGTGRPGPLSSRSRRQSVLVMEPNRG